MRTARTVTAPSGERWRVGRRWMARPLPNPWRKRRGKTGDREGGERGSAWNWFDVPDLGGADDALGGLALVIVGVVVAALVVFVLLPLLGVALELAVLIALSSSGVLGSVFLGRPWTIEAVKIGVSDQTATFAVKGWRRSRRAIRAVSQSIEQTGQPPQLVDPLLSVG
jgi:hypothetical protein